MNPSNGFGDADLATRLVLAVERLAAAVEANTQAQLMLAVEDEEAESSPAASLAEDVAEMVLEGLGPRRRKRKDDDEEDEDEEWDDDES